jgi:hypothetical protein
LLAGALPHLACLPVYLHILYWAKTACSAYLGCACSRTAGVQWFVVRIVWGYSSSYLFWVDTISAYHEALLPVPLVLWYTMANIGLNFLNTMWFCKIVKGAIKALRPAVPRGKKD